jgi:processive 1,2-diacylglycerol beta-glucosyltransferase
MFKFRHVVVLLGITLTVTGCSKNTTQPTANTQSVANTQATPKPTVPPTTAATKEAVAAKTEPTPPTKATGPKRKKIVVLTSKGGYGHMAACATLQKALPDCDLILINPIELAFGFVKKMFFNATDGEGAYNGLLSSGWVSTTNFIVRHPAIWFFYELRPKIERKLYNILRKENADLLISVVPFVNRPAGDAALRCNIPFLLINLDDDLTNWLYSIERCKHPSMLMTVGKLTPRIAKQLKEHKVNPTIVKEVGFVIRQDFYAPKDKVALKKEWNVPANKPVVILMMGGAGSNQLIRYTHELANFDAPLHILVCVGRNTAVIHKINKIKHNANVSVQIIPFTTRISDLLAISDVMITKPGPNACHEAIYAGVPLLIDLTANSLFWERGTIDIVNMYGRGAMVRKFKEVKPLVKKYIAEKRPTKNIFRTLPHFEDQIKPIIYGLLAKSPIQPTLTTPSQPKLTTPSNIKAANGNVVKPTKARQGNPKVG